MNAQAQNAKPVVPEGASLAELVRTQRDLYHRLDRLAQSQRRLIAGEDPTALLSLLSRRQTLTQSLVELGERLAPYRQDWAAACAALEPTQRREVQGMVDEVSDLLGRIIAADEEDARMLTARKAKTAAELTAFRGGRRAMSAYACAEGRAGGSANHRQRINEES